MFRRLVAPLFLSVFAHSAAAAVSIQYRLEPLGGNNYQYVYTIVNDGSISGAVRLFDILFDTALYRETSLLIVTPGNLHPQWSEQILSSVPGLPATYDVLALSGGIASGGSVTGFSVRFEWLGQGVPGPQPFEIYNPVGFVLLQTGTTVAEATAIPSVSTTGLAVIAAGLAFAAALQARRRIAPGL